jgi:hypothetical protein
MKKAPEPNDVDALLNAVLMDGDWHALECSLEREALAAIGQARRKRRWLFGSGQAVGAAALLVGVGWWFRSPASRDVPVAEAAVQPVVGGRFISEEEMLAMFPAGSCVVAEVDGQKELVFFDARKAEEGFVLSSR